MIIAVQDENIRYFAPICQSRIELMEFLLEVYYFTATHKTEMPWDIYDNFEDMATWLYLNNPMKVREKAPLGI